MSNVITRHLKPVKIVNRRLLLRAVKLTSISDKYGVMLSTPHAKPAAICKVVQRLKVHGALQVSVTATYSASQRPNENSTLWVLPY